MLQPPTLGLLYIIIIICLFFFHPLGRASGRCKTNQQVRFVISSRPDEKNISHMRRNVCGIYTDRHSSSFVQRQGGGLCERWESAWTTHNSAGFRSGLQNKGIAWRTHSLFHTSITRLIMQDVYAEARTGKREAGLTTLWWSARPDPRALPSAPPYFGEKSRRKLINKRAKGIDGGTARKIITHAPLCSSQLIRHKKKKLQISDSYTLL